VSIFWYYESNGIYNVQTNEFVSGYNYRQIELPSENLPHLFRVRWRKIDSMNALTITEVELRQKWLKARDCINEGYIQSFYLDESGQEIHIGSYATPKEAMICAGVRVNFKQKTTGIYDVDRECFLLEHDFCGAVALPSTLYPNLYRVHWRKNYN